MPYVSYIKEKYRHFDVELLGAPPLTVAQAIPYYEAGLERLRNDPKRLSGQAVEQVLPDLDGAQLWLGFDLARSDEVGCDHAAAPSEQNFHLLGLETPFKEGQFSRVVNIDIWRLLNAADLSALVLEALRISSEVVLVASIAIDPDSGSEGLASNLDYVSAMLSQHCRSQVRLDGSEMGSIRCSPLPSD
jgi:hypothetical protein